MTGFQDFWITGSRFYFQRNDDSNGALIDMGTITDAVNPTIEPQTAELYDGDGGFQTLVDDQVTRIDEEWEIELRNLSPTNLSIFFLALPASNFEQPSGDDITDVEHTAVVGPGKLVKLLDANGNWVFGVETVTVSNGTTEYVDGVDYQFNDLPNASERGFIKILEDGDIEDGETLEVTMTMKTLSGKRLVLPQTAKGVIKGRGMVVYGRGNNEKQSVREAEISVRPTGSELQLEDYSSITLTARVLSDITASDMPAGRLIQTAGNVPE